MLIMAFIKSREVENNYMSKVAKFLIQGKKIDFELYEKNGMC